MAGNSAFQALVRGNEHVAPPPRVTDGNTSRTARRTNFPRPSQVPVSAGPGLRRAAVAARRANFLRPSQVPESPSGSGVRQALSGPGEPLGRATRSWMENRFESDFSDVRIHRGTEAAASARALGADAYTVGNRIAFAPGAYDPGSAGGRHVLAHELAHVIQQRNERVSGLPIGGDVAVSRPEDSFEQAAENTARQAMESTVVAPPPAPAVRRNPNGITVQRRLWDNVPARFQTKNDLGAANSEYLVTTTGYRRYAPVNIQRKEYNQVYFNSNNRSFLYLTGMPEDVRSDRYDAVYEAPQVQSVVGGTVTLTSRTEPDARPVVADIGPTEGAIVYDAVVPDSGRIDGDDAHVGHTVTALGEPLPTLDEPTVLTEALTALAKLKQSKLQQS